MKNLSKKETLLGMMYSGRDCELKRFCNVSINITYQTIENDIDYLKGLPVRVLNEGTPRGMISKNWYRLSFEN